MITKEIYPHIEVDLFKNTENNLWVIKLATNLRKQDDDGNWWKIPFYKRCEIEILEEKH